jgi:ATPase subunit of ABC transporter with duplicated ATPase domains
LPFPNATRFEGRSEQVPIDWPWPPSPETLIVDEPAKPLDLEASNPLNMAHRRYEGTVLIVAHDLIDEVATGLWNFKDAASQTSKALRRVDGQA